MMGCFKRKNQHRTNAIFVAQPTDAKIANLQTQINSLVRSQCQLREDLHEQTSTLNKLIEGLSYRFFGKLPDLSDYEDNKNENDDVPTSKAKPCMGVEAK